MASPDFLSLCCVSNLTESDKDESDLIYRESRLMNILTMVFSVISLVGVIYLVLPRATSRSDWWRNPARVLTGPNLNSIIKCLILSNVLATAGLLLRTSVWVGGGFPSFYVKGLDSRHIFCAITTVWIELFFMCSFFLHILYSIEASMVANSKELNSALKFIIGGVLPCVFCVTTVIMVYYPGLYQCIERTTLLKDMTFLVFFVPVLAVLAISPVFLFRASTAARRTLIWHFGRYTASERKLVDSIHLKFILIMVVFTLCWLPNLVNALLRATTYEVTQDATVATFILMGVMNPLHGLLGTLVFWGIPRHHIAWSQIFVCHRLSASSSLESNINNSTRTQSQHSNASGSESEPLISFRRRTQP